MSSEKTSRAGAVPAAHTDHDTLARALARAVAAAKDGDDPAVAWLRRLLEQGEDTAQAGRDVPPAAAG
jgi:hypothetical protein